MADNVDVTPGTGKTFATDDIGGVQYPRVKATWGPDGTANDTDVASGKPMPVQVRSSAGVEVTFNGNGAAASSASAPVVLPTDQAAGVAATFTPAASSHTGGDCVGAAATWAAMGASGRPIMITSATLYIDNTAALATAWRLHLYNVTPSSAIADDSPWDFADADVAQYLGYIDLPSTATDIGTNQWAQADGINKQVKLAGTALFGYLVNLTTVTTTATAHIVTLNAVQL